MIREKSFIISKDRAAHFIPIFEIIAHDAPRKSDRLTGARILRELEGVKDWKQMYFTSKEFSMFEDINRKIPEGLNYEGEQFKLFEG